MPVMRRAPRMMVEAKEVGKYPYVAYCEASGCYFIVSAANEEQGQASLDQHKCPHSSTPDRIPGKPLLSAMWRELDACMDGIMLARLKQDSVAGDPRVEHFKSRAGGIAVCLFICLGGAPGYYPDQADITREAVRRYKMRIGEIAWEPTQGDNYDALRDGATERWVEVVNEMKRKGAASREGVNPPPNRAPTVPRARRAPAAARSAAPVALMVPPPMPTTVALSVPPPPPMVQSVPVPTGVGDLKPDVLKGIQNGLKSGLLDHETLASMYGIPVSVVRALDS